MRKICKILVEKPEGKRQLSRLDVDGKIIIIKCILSRF
jgi:hypothetical protein